MKHMCAILARNILHKSFKRWQKLQNFRRWTFQSIHYIKLDSPKNQIFWLFNRFVYFDTVNEFSVIGQYQVYSSHFLCEIVSLYTGSLHGVLLNILVLKRAHTAHTIITILLLIATLSLSHELVMMHLRIVPETLSPCACFTFRILYL